MPPAKSKVAPDDSKSESTNTGKDKTSSHGSSSHQPNGKSRRTATGEKSNLRDVTSASSITAPAPGSAAAPDNTPITGLQWALFDRHVLHTYRRAYRLPVPAAFANDYHRRVLSQPGSIGLQSPTMARRKESRRQSREQLAGAARKHFNSLGAQENDIIVDFLHKIRHQSGMQRSTKPRRPDVKGAGDTR